jgi:hypothetical protein
MTTSILVSELHVADVTPFVLYGQAADFTLTRKKSLVDLQYHLFLCFYFILILIAGCIIDTIVGIKYDTSSVSG